MKVRVDYVGVPSSIAGKPGKGSPWVRTDDGAVALGEPDSAAWWYPVYSPVFFGGGDPDVTVVVHELAHQWFGDSVSVHRWSDIWLNEGFATYAEWLYTERTGGATARQAAAQNYARRSTDSDYWRTLPGDPGAANVIDRAGYSRGAMALQALWDEVGDKDFFTALRTWSSERRNSNGSVQEFLAVVERVSGEQVDDVAQAWLFTPTRPSTPPS